MSTCILGKEKFIITSLFREKRSYSYLYASEKLSGLEYERARKYLLSELEALRLQSQISLEAARRYQKMRAALRRFEATHILADALCAARIRG